MLEEKIVLITGGTSGIGLGKLIIKTVMIKRLYYIHIV